MEEVLRFSRFFNISVFTFETSIVGYAATFPIGESKKVRFYSEKVLFKYLLLPIGAFHALKPCQYRYFIRLRRLLYVPRFEKRYPVTA